MAFLLPVNCDFVLHSTSGAVARTGAAFGQGSGGVFLDDVVCDGFERRLVDCASNPPASSNCPHTRDAGVVCQPIITREFTGLDSVGLWKVQCTLYKNLVYILGVDSSPLNSLY